MTLIENRVDFESVAMFGHSTGAGVAIKTCQSVKCAAAVGLDAWFGPMPDEGLDIGLDIPTLFLMSELWPKVKNTNRIAQFMENSQEALWLTILGTGHYDFSDIPFLSPLTLQLGLSGEIDSKRGQRIVSETSLTFFDHHVRGLGDVPFASDDLGFEELVLKTPASLSTN